MFMKEAGRVHACAVLYAKCCGRLPVKFALFSSNRVEIRS